MLPQPHHGTESRLETWVVKAVFIGFIRAADIFHIEDGFAGKHRVKLQENLRDVAVEILDMKVCHPLPGPVVCKGLLVYAMPLTRSSKV